MRLTYIYHSGFAIEADEFAILIDYYKDTGRSPEKGFVHEKLLNRAGTLYVLSSHFHPDHFNPEVLRWKTYKKISSIFRQRYFEKEPGRERRCDLSQKRRFL